MRTSVSMLPFVGRTIALILLVLGLLFWTGNATTLIPLHMLLGVTLVLLLWTLAILGVIARVNPGLIAVVFVWSLIVPILGVTQTQLLPGPAHWLIRLLHLLVGLVAIVLADTLGKGDQGWLGGEGGDGGGRGSEMSSDAGRGQAKTHRLPAIAVVARALVVFDLVALLFAAALHIRGVHIALESMVFEEPQIIPA